MQRSWKGWLTLGLVLALLTVASAVPAAAPYSGTWAVSLLQRGQETTFWIIKIEDKDGKPEASVVTGLPPVKAAKVVKTSADAKSVQLALQLNGIDITVTGELPKDKTKALLGTLQVNEQVEPLVLSPTELTELNEKNAMRPLPGLDDLQKASGEKEAKERRTAIQAVIEKSAGKPMELFAAQTLLQTEFSKGGSAADIKSAADQLIKIAGGYGPALQQNVTSQVARNLVQTGKEADLAVEYGRKAVSLLPEDSPAPRRWGALSVLASALKKAGKTEEYAKIEEQLDQDFLKNAVPFKTEPYAGRKGKSDRVAVVELFTGAQCPPCVSADIAFDAALKAYKPGDALFLQYHLHIPGPDPLTNSDTEARAKYYGDEIQGTPTMFLDGKTTPAMGGFRPNGKDRFDKLSELINAALEKEPGAQVKLTATRKGDKVDLAADVTDVKKPGDKVRLRFVVVEDVVRYPGRNGQRMHHHVVRAFPGGVEGFALKEKTAKQTASFTLADLQKSLKEYLEKANKDRPFLDDERPLKLEDLKVVALVQDDDSKEIIQAVQAAVPAAKE
jgi:hypothetical protein